jgi:hypothetical protein
VGISVVQTKNQLITSATATHTFVFPTSVTPGNWIVIVWRQGTDNRTPNTPTAGAGSYSPTLDFTMNSGTTANRVYCWSGQHTGTATDTFQLTIQSSATAIGGFQAFELSGVDVSGTPRGSSATQALSSGTSGNLIASPGIDLTADDIIIGALSESKAGWGTLTAPSGFTTRLSNNSAGAVTSTWVGDRLTAGSGITGAWTITSSRAVFTGYQVYLQAPGGGGGGGSTAGNLLTLGVG